MDYKEYKKFFKLLCSSLRKKYSFLEKEEIEDIVSETICDFLAKFGCCSFCVSYPKTFAWIIKKSNEKIRYELSKRNKYLQDSLLLASIQYLQNIEIILDYNDLVSKILKGLSEDKQELLLYLLNGYKVKEIAENYNITISAAEKRVQRLKKYLRENYNLEI